jgi:penicillin G amidase
MPVRRPSRILRFIKRFLATVIVLLVLFLAGVCGWVYRRTRAALPQVDGTLTVAGLKAPVEVRRDARGVPHIRAQSLEDVFFAQGYVTAQDRLWQMDLNRRYAFGNLSEIFGEKGLHFDIEHRTLGFRQVAQRAVNEMEAASRAGLAAYTRGVNAFISTHRDHLPVEFAILHYQMQPWQEADCVGVAMNMALDLSTSWPGDLMREHVKAKLSLELYANVFPDKSPLDHPVAEMVPGPSAPVRQSEVLPTADPSPTDALLDALGPDDSSPPGLGSNNWVVSGAHTQSGKPLLSNDPHLAHSIPSVWYMVHLKAPGLDVSGVSFPGLPSVVLGHNARIAWGATNTGPDVQDLYIESFNLHDPSKYLHEGKWESAEVRDEDIKIRGKNDYHLTVRVTRHGPVVSEDGDRDLALCWTMLKPGAMQFPFLAIDRAANWNDFTNALRSFAGPMQNFIYADVDGNIGYYAAGWVPVRKHGDGTVPMMGSTDDNDWAGYIPFEGLPHSYNPKGGIIATANGRIVPDGYPYYITSRWEAPYRTARIYQLLRAGSKLTPRDMLKIQMDIRPLDDVWLAKKLEEAAQQHPPRTADGRYAISLLQNWNGEAAADSGATLVCEHTRHTLLRRLLVPKLGEDLTGYSWPMSTVFIQNVIDNNLVRWLPQGDADFNATLISALEAAVAGLPDAVKSQSRSAWRWGYTIPLTFHHPLGDASPILGYFFNVGPFPQAGTSYTVKATSMRHGPSMRMDVDFSDFDNSLQNITVGESGEVLSPNYKDQVGAWLTGQSFPMLFTDQAVDQGAVHRLTLEPAGR